MAHRPIPMVLALSLALALTACGGDGGGERGGSPPTGPGGGDGAEGELVAQSASYDLAVGPPSRFIVGVFNPEKGPLGHGQVELRFFFLGEQQASGKAQPGPVATGRYLPLPGSPPPPAGAGSPVFLAPEERGVYAAEVAFDRAGFWGVEVRADIAGEGGSQTAGTAFKVLPRHEVPFPGEAAIASENLTAGSPGVPPGAIDSRADAERPVPDPELHATTVAAALREGRPVLLVISTPTFCVSQFCGPVTDMVAGLAKDYADRARFIHIEVWRDFEGKQLNEAAGEWIARGENINEPWVFLIGADGKIAARWDNVASRSEIEPLLQTLPKMPPG